MTQQLTSNAQRRWLAVRRALCIGALALGSCAPEAPKPPRLSERAVREVAAFEKGLPGPDAWGCAACHVAPTGDEPAVADVDSLEFMEFFGGFSMLSITTSFGADGHVVRRTTSPDLPAGQERVDSCDLYSPTWERALARVLGTGYFRVASGSLSSCFDIASVKILIRTHDGRIFSASDPCWGVHSIGGDADHPGFGTCVAVLREMMAQLDYGMPGLEPRADLAPSGPGEVANPVR